MKLAFCSNGIKALPLSSRIRGFLLFSTETQTSKPKKIKKDTLYSRVIKVGNDQSVSVVPVLDQWANDGKHFTKNDLIIITRNLKGFKRFKHACETSQWLCNQRYFDPSPSDIAVNLDLISRIHGIEQAEKYFNYIPKESQEFPVYLSLLNCYANSKAVEKAEALMNKMKELGFMKTSMAYNVMGNLYTKVGQFEKLNPIMAEMRKEGIPPNKVTFSIRLSGYAATSNIDGIERTIQIMEAAPEVTMDWNCYAIAAKGYIKAGLIDKALEMLKKTEELSTGRKRKYAYDSLLALYADTGKKEELYRIWDQYKKSEKLYNSIYRRMIGSLLKLDDINGAEKILEEWESGNKSHDFRVPNLLVAVYCKNGVLENAEMLVNKAVEKGKKPYADTWGILATAYVEHNQIPKAVEALKAAFLKRRSGWKPHRDTLAACLAYMKQLGNAEKTEEFVRLLGAPGHMSINDCEKLLDYIYDKQEESKEMSEIDEDSMDSDDENVDETA
ncbi:hypothetical protein AQUCO_00800217v1 [Aquilegia coerulea]|uniref:Pentacotripeptide-repeat region of PRORP domain-containing protein n=1 Tax=Aquilegia coerulea TaxID=218851 RepID=A0A2G5EHS6_AQUCA|nr:hypothetical protein AQUCO_00800217v1 [Aquilegia coerulea]